MLLGISCIYINIHFFNGDSLYSILLLYFLQIEALHNSGHCQGVKKGVKKWGGGNTVNTIYITCFLSLHISCFDYLFIYFSSWFINVSSGFSEFSSLFSRKTQFSFIGQDLSG